MAEILVKFRDGAVLRERNGQLESEGRDLSRFNATIANARDVKRSTCSELEPERVREYQESITTDKIIPKLDLFVRVTVPEGADAENWIRRIQEDPQVEYAALARPIEPPSAVIVAPTPDLTSYQDYLAETGINAIAAWAKPGGTGLGVKVCDCERGFIPDHEDLPDVKVLSGTERNLSHEDLHGTRTLGVLFAKQNDIGVTGICHEATAIFSSLFGISASTCIWNALRELRAGDILVLEMEIGKLAHETTRLGVPVEWDAEVHATCCLATARGIVVVAAAGNGDRNLDDFPDIARRLIWSPEHANDSGAILVGGGAPPADPALPYRARVSSSSYGSRVNCQGWASRVATTGGGSPDEIISPAPPFHRSYTHNYHGTSSATAMIAGVCAALQGIHKRVHGSAITPQKMRDLLSKVENGQEQVDASTGTAVSHHIGPLPNLGKLIAAIGA